MFSKGLERYLIIMPEIQGTRVGRNVTQYDYTNQAWVVDGLYQECELWNMNDECLCFGHLHAGEPVRDGVDLHPLPYGDPLPIETESDNERARR